MSTSPPRIEFPCDYPIKVVAEHSEDFLPRLIAALQPFAALSAASFSVRRSKAARYVSYGFSIIATGEQQLMELHTTLRAVHGVRLVL